MKTLVTGGAGFIGSHIVRRLLDDGHEVRVIDNLSTGDRDNVADVAQRIEFIEGDIRHPGDCDRACGGTELIFHVAALPSVPRSIANPWASHDHNVNGTMQLLEAARRAGSRRVVFSSSSSVYGDTAVLPKVETMEPLCRSPYATAKLAGEQYVLAYARAGLLEGVALRYFNVFGPRQSPTSAYAAVSITICPMLAISLWQGTKSIDKDLIDMSTAFHATPWSKVVDVILPQLISHILAAIRYGLGLAWKVVVVVEMFGFSNGVGYQVVRGFNTFSMKAVLAWAITFLIVMIFIEFGLIGWLESRVTRWRPKIQAWRR